METSAGLRAGVSKGRSSEEVPVSAEIDPTGGVGDIRRIHDQPDVASVGLLAQIKKRS